MVLTLRFKSKLGVSRVSLPQEEDATVGDLMQEASSRYGVPVELIFFSVQEENPSSNDFTDPELPLSVLDLSNGSFVYLGFAEDNLGSMPEAPRPRVPSPHSSANTSPKRPANQGGNRRGPCGMSDFPNRFVTGGGG